MAIRNAMSVDIEDWFQVGAFENCIDRDDWPRLESRVAANSEAVLDLYAEMGVKATFFTLGWVAEKCPLLMRRIVDEGHELASHGYDHARVFNMDRATFAADLDRTKKLLEDASGVEVIGYRAPSFSIDKRTPWAHEVLAEKGYRYSSSVAPIAHDHYGWPESPRFAWNPVAGSPLVEFPVTTAHFVGRRMAAGGGGFFRLLPYWLSRAAIAQVNGEGQSAIFYFHPWEIDPAQPRVADAPLKSKFRHYTNLSKMADKLRHVMRDFEWCRMDEMLAAHKAAAEKKAAA